MRKSVAPGEPDRDSSSEPVAKCDRFAEESRPHRKYLPHVAETSSLRSQFVTLKTGRVRNLEVCT